MTRSRRSKRVTILVGLGTVLLLAGAILAFRDALVAEWSFYRAARECARAWKGFEGADDALERCPALGGLVAQGPKAYPVLARLVDHPETDVAWCARYALYDADEDGALAVDSFLAYLAAEHPECLVEFRLQSYACCAGDPGGGVDLNLPGCGGSTLREHYLGRSAPGLRATARAVERARKRLWERDDRLPEPDSDSAWIGDFETVDITALMVVGDGDDAPRVAEGPGVSPAQAALDLLREVALDPGTYPELRLHAWNRLESVRAGPSVACLPQLWHWELASKTSTALGGDLSRPFLNLGTLHHPGALRALLSLDHPRVLRILARLLGNPEVQEAIEEADVEVRCEGVGSAPWLPLHERAAKWLGGTRVERILAAEALAELAPQDAAPLLADALRAEADPEVRLRLEASLVAFEGAAGSETSLRSGVYPENVRRAFQERVAAWRSTFPPVDTSKLRGGPWSWRAPRVWPLDVESGNRQEEDVLGASWQMSPYALGLALCRSGSREDLERVLDAMLPSAYRPLVVLELGRAVQGLWARDVLSRYWGRDASDLIPLLDSWKASRARLTWDPTSRRWRGWTVVGNDDESSPDVPPNEDPAHER